MEEYIRIPMTEKRERTIQNAVQNYGQRLFRFIRDRVRTNSDAEDILQDVWYQLSNVVDLEGIEQVSSWLFRVARNRVTDSYRKKKPDLLEDYAYENEEGDISFREILLADDQTPETEALREAFWEALFDALDELPENQKNVFVWNELEDKTFQQISDETGINIKTLISRKRYAVQHLRKRLQNLYDDFFED
jgi:RNA polymerase sigma factor (sigma-70 family)